MACSCSTIHHVLLNVPQRPHSSHWNINPFPFSTDTAWSFLHLPFLGTTMPIPRGTSSMSQPDNKEFVCQTQDRGSSDAALTIMGPRRNQLCKTIQINCGCLSRNSNMTWPALTWIVQTSLNFSTLTHFWSASLFKIWQSPEIYRRLQK